MEIINLKNDISLINQYIELRNRHAHLLLTDTVNKRETSEWLKKPDIEVVGLVENNILLGVAIIYFDRNGEIAFFAKEPNKGIGSKLLILIEDIALRNNLQHIWAWTLEENQIAQRTFEKGGFQSCGKFSKIFKGKTQNGIKFIKSLSCVQSSSHDTVKDNPI
jgi:RimJ/RimL family protein N-acetyltransferase